MDLGKSKHVNAYKVINLMLCLCGFFIIVAGTQKYGPGVTHDSVAYLFSASSLAEGQGLLYFGYTSPFVQWPPLFSFILAIPELLGLNPLYFSLYFNALAMPLALWVTSLTVSHFARYKLISTLFILMGVVSFPLIKMSFFVWSEPLFVLFASIIFHILLTRNFKKDKIIKRVIVMAVITALACLTRYIGVVLIALVCLYLLFAVRGFKNKVVHVFLYGFISSVPTVVYLLRNYLVSGTLVGMRSPSGISLSTNIQRATKTILNWLFPIVSNPEGLSVPAMIAISAVCIAFIVLFVMILKNKSNKSEAVILLLMFCIFYSLYMAVSASKVAFDPIGDRYMIPVMVPLLTVVTMLIDSNLGFILSSASKHRLLKIVNLSVALLLLGFIGYYLSSNAMILKNSTIKAYNEGAGGYNTTEWKNHAFLSQKPLIQDSDMIYSNNPSAVHFIMRKPSHYTPKTFGLPLYGYDAFLKESSLYKKQTVVWFGQEASTTVYTPAMLEKDFTMTQVFKGNTFTIYTMERRGL